jgi:hypothetical protein
MLTDPLLLAPVCNSPISLQLPPKTQLPQYVQRTLVQQQIAISFA